jgi:hypothetical protein
LSYSKINILEISENRFGKENMTKSSTRVRSPPAKSYATGNYTGWFEIYTEAQGNLDAIPWVDRVVNPLLLN